MNVNESVSLSASHSVSWSVTKNERFPNLGAVTPQGTVKHFVGREEIMV
jgi:hypothetical protein